MGRWFVRIVGPRVARKVQESAAALRSEYEAGRQESQEKPPRDVPHRVVESTPIEKQPPDESDQTSRDSGSA